MNESNQSRFWTPAGWSAPPPSPLSGRDWMLPGIANIHSHAFQRAMSGLTERRGPGADSFWSWRERMYSMAARFEPDTLRDVAAQLYMEMLEVGYTSVCEFHYLHHAADGKAYANPAEMALALIDAAREVGIGLVLLPTLYQVGGFDQRPLAARQKRFFHTTDAYLNLLQRLDATRGPTIEIGFAFHSLRAVTQSAISEVLAARSDREQPIHLHIAEQVAEVDDCLAQRGARPVAWLLDHVGVDRNWCLVHATHLDAPEVSALAASGACVALCPTTEANLGDGLFPLSDYLAAGGCLGLGSDSHATVALSEELRWLEYGQRLLHRGRNIAAQIAHASTGETLFAAALAGGRQASGNSIDAGCFSLRADAVELAERRAGDIIDSWLFGSSRALVRDVWVNGVQQVFEGRHHLRDHVEVRYRRALSRLFSNT
ncbi:MAG: formimidoylglutamate deiminase [Pseudomarimonas sp.]